MGSNTVFSRRPVFGHIRASGELGSACRTTQILAPISHAHWTFSILRVLFERDRELLGLRWQMA
jgi:hypothetical protein